MSEPRILETLQITENKKYETVMQKNHGGTEKKPNWEDVFLFSVFVSTPFETFTINVLSFDEESACCQALCYKKLENYNNTDEFNAAVVTQAKKVPLIIRGWGGKTFMATTKED